MTLNLDKLEVLADAATLGPWKQDCQYVVGQIVGGRPGGEVIIQCTPTVDRYRHDQGMISCNAAYVAAADPATIKALIAQIRRLQTLYDAGEKRNFYLEDRVIELEADLHREKTS